MTETSTEGFIAENLVVIPFKGGIAQSADYLSLDVDQPALSRRVERALRDADSAMVVYGPSNIGIVNSTDQIPGTVDAIFRALDVLRNQRAVQTTRSAAMHGAMGTRSTELVAGATVNVSMKKSRGANVPKLTMTFSEVSIYEETLELLENVLGICADGSGDEHSDNYTGGHLTYLSNEKGYVHVTRESGAG